MAMLIYQRVSTNDFSISMLNGSSNALFGGFHSHGGNPKLAGWFILENPKQKWMKMDENWGYPHFRKPPYDRMILTRSILDG